MTALDIFALWLLFHVFDAVCWFLWRLTNLVSDKFLRRNGWDEADEWAPMSDYIPFWRLFRGVEDMGPRSSRRRI